MIVCDAPNLLMPEDGKLEVSTQLHKGERLSDSPALITYSRSTANELDTRRKFTLQLHCKHGVLSYLVTVKYDHRFRSEMLCRLGLARQRYLTLA